MILQNQLPAKPLADVDAIVIGAGVAGLAAAAQLKQAGAEVLILEAQNRIGGRIFTEQYQGLAVEIGAAWVHKPKGNPITKLARKAGGKFYLTSDDSVMYFDVTGNRISDSKISHAEKKFNRWLAKASNYAEKKNKDISLEKALKGTNRAALQSPLTKFFLSAYLEFDFGSDISQMSAWYYNEDKEFAGEDIILTNGYSTLTNYLSRGLDIRLNNYVKKIEYGSDGVAVTTNKGIYEAYAAVVTVPLGVLKKQQIKFDPPLPKKKRKAIRKLGMGNVNKVFLIFDKPFWPVKTQYFGYMANTKGKYNYFVNCRTFSKVNALVTFAFGAFADKIEKQSNAQIQADVMTNLRAMFGSKAKDPKKIIVTRWRKDRFAHGAYSYNAVGAKRKDFTQIGKPVGKALYFAGEHTSADYAGSVHGAYMSGIRAAKEALRAHKEF